VVKVFVSYAREDRDWVERFAVALETAGLCVWWDRALLAGDDIEAEIDRQLAAADVVIVVWSAASAASNWVRSEANAGLEAGKLVPAQIAPVRIPRPFDQFHTANLAAWPEAAGSGFEALVLAIRATASGTRPQPGPSPRQARQRTLWPIGAAVSAVVITAAFLGDVSGLVSSLAVGGKDDELRGRMRSIDSNIAALAGKENAARAAIDERYLREVMRRLQMAGQPVDDLTLVLVKTQAPDDAAAELNARYVSESARLTPARKVSILHQAAALYLERDHDKAIARYQEILRIDPADFVALAGLARLYVFRSDTVTAKLYIDAARSLTPPNRASEFDLEIMSAYVDFLADDIAGSEQKLKALKAEAESAEFDLAISFAATCLGQVYAYTGRNEEARAELESIASLQTENDFFSHMSSAQSTLGAIAFEEGRFDDAHKHYESFLETSEVLGRLGSIASA
jgi:tetratricopeptide (TPR) repeat protein